MMEFIRFKRGQQQAKYIRLEPQFEGNAFLPQYAMIPLAFREQTSGLPLVSVGDFVNEGQMIARARNSLSAHVHASVPGVVSGIIDTQLPNGHSFREYISVPAVRSIYLESSALPIHGNKAIRQDFSISLILPV